MLWGLFMDFDEPCVWDSNTPGWMFSASRFGGNGLIYGLVGGSVLSVGPRLINKLARGTAVASIAEAFGREWTIGCKSRV